MPREKTLAQIIAGVLSISFAGKLLQVTLAVVIARLLQPESYGIYALSLTLSFVFVRFTNLGWPVTLNRLLPKFLAGENLAAFKGALLAALWTVTAITLLALIVLLVFATAFTNTRESQQIVFCVLLIMPFLGGRVLLRNILAALGSPRRGLSVEDLIPAAITLTCTGLALLQDIAVSPIHVALLYCLANLCSVCLGGFWLKQILPEGLRHIKSEVCFKSWMKSSTTVMWGQAARMLLNRADLIMLGALSTLETTGLYAVALRLCQLLVLPSNAVQTYIAPRISSLVSAGDDRETRKLFRLSLGFAFVTSVPTALMFGLFPVELVTYTFGVDYAAAANVLMLLAISKVFMSLSNSLSSYMLMMANERVFGRLAMSSMIVNLGLNAALIPGYGAVGAAFATCVAVFLLCISQLWYCRGGLLKASAENSM